MHNNSMFSMVQGGEVIEFFGQKFYSDKRVLTPRLETEVLVKKTIGDIRSNPVDVVIDVGTGSGVIAISLKNEFADVKIFGLDISPDAIEVAKYNARNLEAMPTFLVSNLLSNLDIHEIESKNIFIVANLPYIQTGDIEVGEDVLQNDPPIALYGGDATGLELIEKLLIELRELSTSALSVRVGLEFGHTQSLAIKEMIQPISHKYSFFCDYSGIERFVIFEYEKC